MLIPPSFIVRDAPQWCRQPDALPQDFFLCAYLVSANLVYRLALD
jgi:hypothetical protein